MVCCFSVTCLFCTFCVFIGSTSLVQLCLGIYLTFIQTDIVTINHLIKTDKFDSYLTYILLLFIGLGFISLILVFSSIFGMAKRNRPLSMFITILWLFVVAVNISMVIILVLYYYFVIPELNPLLVRSLQQSPSVVTNLLDTLQAKYTCCGINDKDDYNNLPLDSYPTSCCRVPDCWRDNDVYVNVTSSTMSMMHINGCFPIVDRLVTIELWIIVGLASVCACFQILALTFMCIITERYKTVNHNLKLPADHANSVNGNNKIDFQGSSKTIEEIVEVTQI